ncbi:MAG TPA: type II toxin-antitoxin system HicB family antitoxin [Bryobacteraceae bacterium]|jgi:antitoxin HicB|nr:type II toxin-antitoxin system HicB family antitoxin [Bryobacteraceae bacterium]
MKAKSLVYPAVFSPEKKGYSISFPDFPEANSQGDDDEDAFRMAVDCLNAVLEYRMEEKAEIPAPSPVRKGQRAIPVSLDLAPKLALYQLMHDQKISNVKLARKLRISEVVVRRMLDPNHQSKPEQYTRALAALDAAVQVSVVKLRRSA